MRFDRGHALVIGVGSYAHMPKSNLPISVKDAERVKQVLCDPDLCGYRPESVTLLHDAVASRAGILGALDALAATTKPEDTVLLFYCGHGVLGSDGNYYLTTHDSRPQGARIVKGTGVGEGELLAKLRAIQAERLLLLFNACYSGEISPSLGPGPGAGDGDQAFGDKPLPTAAAEAILSAGKGRIIITACGQAQKSYYMPGAELTYFSQALVDGLSGQGYVPNNGGYVSAYGLYVHLYEAVKEEAARWHLAQEPVLTVLQGKGPFPVALYRGASDLGAFKGESVPQGMGAREVDPERSLRIYENKMTAYVISDTATAQGDGAKAASGRGAIVEGSGHQVQTGDKSRIINAGEYVETKIVQDPKTAALERAHLVSAMPGPAVQRYPACRPGRRRGGG